MEIKHNANLTKRSQELRKNATRQENHLWYDFLCKYPLRFHRQVAIDRYIVDFYCAKAKIVIELDGSQHYTDEGQSQDTKRTAILAQYGLAVVRFSNSDIDSNFEGVCSQIDLIVREQTEK